MSTHAQLPRLAVSPAQVEMELLFLSPHSQEHCLSLIMQLDATAVRRYHSVMEWLLAA